VAVGASVVVLVLWSGWVGQLRTRPERSLGSNIVHWKVRLGFREPGGSQGVAQ